MAEDVEAFDSERDDFGGALFGKLNNKDSRLNVLIGSRKFTEGWSSWRVSTMGLLNMGQGEGSQIIRSEEHTSELQSLMRISYAVFCLKKKKKYIISETATHRTTSL